MEAPEGYSKVFLPAVTDPVMVWQCGDCAAVLAPSFEAAVLHDRWHDRIQIKGRGRHR